MKRIIKAVLAVSMSLGLIACETSKPTSAPVVDDPSRKSTGVMTYEEYVNANLDSEIVIETYVQAKQSWWEDHATVYTQDLDGAYFLYNMNCTKEEYESLIPGQKILVTGYKSVWAGEIEIVDAIFELEDGNYIAEPKDVTDLLNSDDIINDQNKFVSFKNMKIESEAIYKWDGSGIEGDDLYFDASYNGKKYTFTVETYLCDDSTNVYKKVLGLKKGDKVDLEGFLYWYNGINPHITSVRIK